MLIKVYLSKKCNVNGVLGLSFFSLSDRTEHRALSYHQDKEYKTIGVYNSPEWESNPQLARLQTFTAPQIITYKTFKVRKDIAM